MPVKSGFLEKYCHGHLRKEAYYRLVDACFSAYTLPLLYICPRTAIFVPSYYYFASPQVGDICYYVCALILPYSVYILLYMRHHKRRRELQRYVQALVLLYGSSYYYICVLVQAGVMCSDTCKCVDCRNTCAKVYRDTKKESVQKRKEGGKEPYLLIPA